VDETARALRLEDGRTLSDYSMLMESTLFWKGSVQLKKNTILNVLIDPSGAYAKYSSESFIDGGTISGTRSLACLVGWAW
jgi:hypothetical protein